ncbi:MAG: hypothetical protein ACYTGC_00395, partial [Planctomycetota bacterium]
VVPDRGWSRRMHVLIDGQRSELQADTVSAVLSAAADAAKQRGRIIVEVEVDGELTTGAALDAIFDGQTRAEEIRLSTADLTEQVRRALSAAQTELSSVDELQCQAAELIEGGQTAAAFQRLGEALEIWQRVQEAISIGSSLMELPLHELMVNGEPGSDLVERLGRHLRVMLQSLKTDDPIGLSDTLLYEMPPVIQDWRDLLSDLKRMSGKGIHGGDGEDATADR